MGFQRLKAAKKRNNLFQRSRKYDAALTHKAKPPAPRRQQPELQQHNRRAAA